MRVPRSAPEMLRRRLRELGWSQAEFAARVGASPSQVCRWLSGDRTPSLKHGLAVERATGVRASAWVSTPSARTGTEG